MKPADVLLLSIAIGLTVLTAYLFTSDYPGRELSPTEGPQRPVRAIIVHKAATPHPTIGGDPPFHVIVGPEPVYTRYWDNGAALPHTGETRMDEGAISVGLQDGAKVETLVNLLSTLCRKYDLPARMVLSHEQVDPAVGCPGPVVDMDALRAAIGRRLGGTAGAPAGKPDG